MQRLQILLGLSALCLAPSCSSTKVGQDQVGPTNSKDTITAAEWATFANTLRDSIIETGVVERYRGPQGQPVIVAVADFSNDTHQPQFTRTKDIMYNELRKALVNTGKIVVNMDVAGTGGDVDGLLQSIRDLPGSDAYQGDVQPWNLPRLLINGQFIDVRYEEGRTSRSDYACAVRLIDVQQGYTVWEDQIILPKEFTRGFFGL